MQTSTSSLPTSLVPLEQLPSGVSVIHLGRSDEATVTLTKDRLQQLRAVIAQVKDIRPRGLIIVGPHADMFTVGADVNVIGEVTDPTVGANLAREGQKIFDEIASLPFPTIAAISGPCVGGGFELALSCTYRICTDNKSTIIGLPEVKLGILPGFGGTQRLPRLIGIQRALDIILAGKTLRAKKALQVGLVSECVTISHLINRAENILLGKAPTHQRPLSYSERFLTFTSLGRNIVRRSAAKTINKQSKGFYPAPPLALDSVLYGLSQGMNLGFENEAKNLGRLIVTPESKALVKIFFLTESAKAIGKPFQKLIGDISGVVVGAGTMGAGIAGLLAQNEIPVILKDTDESALSRGMEHIRKTLAKASYLSESEKSNVTSRIEKTTKDSPNLSRAQLVIEAIVEKIDVKQAVLLELAKALPDDSLIATNTSSLSVSDIAAGIPHPERVVGMHFFNPVEKMPLVEIIRGKQTSDKVIILTAALATRLGKFPVIVEDVPGFLVNRILSPYLNAATYLLGEGYSIEAIDKAALAFGMPMGPLRLLDEVGLDVITHVSEVMVNGYGARMKAPDYATKLVEQGRKGKKSGAGFYNFTSDGKGSPAPNIRDLLKISSEAKTSPNRTHIIEVLILSLVNEAVRCLDEGVAGTPGRQAAYQVDLATVMGMGFPPFRGGVLHYADAVGADEILASLETLEKQYGERFKPADGIVRRAKDKKSFFEK